MIEIAFTVLIAVFGNGFSFQEGSFTEEEWGYLMEELMIRMTEEEWEEGVQSDFPQLFPENEIMGNETVSGRRLLELLLDENTDLETRLLILETLRRSEDSSELEEVLRAFSQEAGNDPPKSERKALRDEPQTKLEVVSRTVLVPLESKKMKEESSDFDKTKWTNILIGGLALTLAAGFFFVRRGLHR